MELLFALCEIEIHEFRRAVSQNVHRLLWVSSFHREAEIYDEIFEPQIDGGDFEIDEGFCAAIIISRIIGIAARGNWLLDQISTVYAYPPLFALKCRREHNCKSALYADWIRQICRFPPLHLFYCYRLFYVLSLHIVRCEGEPDRRYGNKVISASYKEVVWSYDNCDRSLEKVIILLKFRGCMQWLFLIKIRYHYTWFLQRTLRTFRGNFIAFSFHRSIPTTAINYPLLLTAYRNFTVLQKAGRGAESMQTKRAVFDEKTRRLLFGCVCVLWRHIKANLQYKRKTRVSFRVKAGSLNGWLN